MTQQDVVNEAKKLANIHGRFERNAARRAFLDANFTSAYAWNLADKIIDEVLQFGTTAGRNLTTEILDD